MDGGQPTEKREVHYGGMYNRFFIRSDDNVLIGDNPGNERTMYDLRQDPHEFPEHREGKPPAVRGDVPARAGAGGRAVALLRVGDGGDAGRD